MNNELSEVYDYVVIGSGFGGSVSAMRLTEKGYSVLVLERGKRYDDQDFAKTNWALWKYLWAPKLRCFGILQITPMKDVIILHGSGVGGGSLGYANVLMEPDGRLLNAPSWRHLADWKNVLRPHYDTARAMLGVYRNPKLWKSDQVLNEIAAELGQDGTFHPTDVGVFFGRREKEGDEVPDPFFDGEGPARNTCIHCGGCLVGCRYNAKNTLVKNYLYLAEKWGSHVLPEAEVQDVRPLQGEQADGARYEVFYLRTTAWFVRPTKTVRARNVIFAAGALGTMRLLFRCRETTGSLPKISQRLGELVRTNSEALLGATSRIKETDYSHGVAITSFFQADEVTAIEPVRYPKGSSVMRFLAGPLVESGGSFIQRLWRTVTMSFTHPVDFLRTYILPGWAEQTTILLVMQAVDNHLQVKLGRHLFTLWERNLVSNADTEKPIHTKIDVGHQITRRFAAKTNSAPAGTLNEGLLNIPMTAHIMGGCSFGFDDQDGVIGLDCQIHNYPGLYIVDGSIIPGNPGVNPSLTITALAEYAMSLVPPKSGAVVRQPIGVSTVKSLPEEYDEPIFHSAPFN